MQTTDVVWRKVCFSMWKLAAGQLAAPCNTWNNKLQPMAANTTGYFQRFRSLSTTTFISGPERLFHGERERQTPKGDSMDARKVCCIRAQFSYKGLMRIVLGFFFFKEISIVNLDFFWVCDWMMACCDWCMWNCFDVALNTTDIPYKK